MNAEHRDLDDVGGAALDRGVQSGPFGHLAEVAVVAGEVGQVATPAHDRLGETGLAGVLDDGTKVVPDTAEAGEVRVHLAASLVCGDLELTCQAEGRKPVGEPV